MKLKRIIDTIEKWAPLNTAEDFDNVGLILGNESSIVSKAIITLDTLENVVDDQDKAW